MNAINGREPPAPPAGPPQGRRSQHKERAQPANNRHPRPRGGGWGVG